MSAATHERLLDAMLEEITEQGYEGVTVSAAMQRVGLPARESLDESPGRDAFLFAAYEQLTSRLLRRVLESCAEGGKWPVRVRRGLAALLDELAAQPRLAQALTRSFPSICPEAQARYRAFIEGLAPMLYEGRAFSGIPAALPNEVEMLAVGAAEAIIFEEVEAGRAAQLPDMCPSILFSMLVPFLGPKGALEETRQLEGAA